MSEDGVAALSSSCRSESKIFFPSTFDIRSPLKDQLFISHENRHHLSLHFDQSGHIHSKEPSYRLQKLIMNPYAISSIISLLPFVFDNGVAEGDRFLLNEGQLSFKDNRFSSSVHVPSHFVYVYTSPLAGSVLILIVISSC